MRAARSEHEGDQASTVALEAIGLAFLFCFGLAILEQTMEHAAGLPRASARAIFETQAKDLLQALYTMPDAGYPSKYTRIAVECLNGNTTTWDHYVARSLPPGTLGRFTLRDTDTRELTHCGDESPPGESAGAERDLRLDYNPALVVPRVGTLDGTTDNLEPLVVSLHNGYSVVPDIPVTITAETSDGTNYTAAASFRTGTGPHATMSLRKSSADLWFWSERGSNNFVLRVNNTDNTRIRAGIELRVHLPRLWSNVAIDTGDSATSTWWTSFNQTPTPEGWLLQAILKQPLGSGAADFSFFANPSSDEALFHAWATLDQGRMASANFVFAGAANTQSESAVIPVGLQLSLPPVLGSNTVWGMTFANPSNSGLTSVTVTRITIRQPQNTSIFQGLGGGGGGTGHVNGWSVVDNSTLQWQGLATVRPNQAYDFSVPVTTANLGRGADLDNADGNVQVSFPAIYDPTTAPLPDGFGITRNLTQRATALAFSGRIPPTNATIQGYPLQPPPNPNSRALPNPDPIVCSALHFRNAAYRGCSPYKISTTSLLLPQTSPDIARGAEAATVTPLVNLVQPGSTIVLHADFTALSALMSQNTNVQSFSLANISALTPWPAQPLTPQAWPRACTSGNLGNTAAPDYRCTIPANAPYGTYAVLATAQVTLKDRTVVEVNAVSAFNVGENPAWPTHTLYPTEALLWLPDWT